MATVAQRSPVTGWQMLVVGAAGLILGSVATGLASWTIQSRGGTEATAEAPGLTSGQVAQSKRYQGLADSLGAKSTSIHDMDRIRALRGAGSASAPARVSRRYVDTTTIEGIRRLQARTFSPELNRARNYVPPAAGVTSIRDMDRIRALRGAGSASAPARVSRRYVDTTTIEGIRRLQARTFSPELNRARNYVPPAAGVTSIHDIDRIRALRGQGFASVTSGSASSTFSPELNRARNYVAPKKASAFNYEKLEARKGAGQQGASTFSPEKSRALHGPAARRC